VLRAPHLQRQSLATGLKAGGARADIMAISAMTPERSHAYKLVMRTLQDVGPSKLHADEQARVRAAADELLFSHDLWELGAHEALREIESLCSALVRSGRWEPLSARRLADAVIGCGPPRVAQAQAA